MKQKNIQKKDRKKSREATRRSRRRRTRISTNRLSWSWPSNPRLLEVFHQQGCFSLTHRKLASRRRLTKSLKMSSSCCCWKNMKHLSTSAWEPDDCRLGFGPDAVRPGHQGRRLSCSPWRSVAMPLTLVLGGRNGPGHKGKVP